MSYMFEKLYDCAKWDKCAYTAASFTALLAVLWQSSPQKLSQNNSLPLVSSGLPEFIAVCGEAGCGGMDV